jgi:uncharacterized membrane protein YdjX (TVP38/TMEM64 family)
MPYSWIATVMGFAFSDAYESNWAVMAIGTISIFFGAWIGSVIAFLMGRYLWRDFVQKMVRKSQLLMAIDKTIEKKGLKLMILMRLSLLIPFNVSNYVLGGSGVQAKDFVIGTIGILPIVIFFVYLGSTMSSIQNFMNGNHGFTTFEIVMMSIGGVLVLCVLLIISHYVSTIIKGEMKK